MGFQGFSFVAKRHQATVTAARNDPAEIELPATLRKRRKPASRDQRAQAATHERPVFHFIEIKGCPVAAESQRLGSTCFISS
jgi:hypothetical protein